jgi:hypothetical protein
MLQCAVDAQQQQPPTTKRLIADTILKSAVLWARVMYSSTGAMNVLASASHTTACCRVPGNKGRECRVCRGWGGGGWVGGEVT